MTSTMNLASDKIRYYTNIVLSGSLASLPVVFYYYNLGQRGDEFFLFTAGISILFVGRICLELALFVENTWIDNIVSCRVKNLNYYNQFPEPGNQFNEHWYGYLLLEDGKVGKDIISHLADRLLFFLSTSIGSIIGTISMFFLFPIEKYASIVIVAALVIYVVITFKHCIWLSSGLDYLRYRLLESDKRKKKTTYNYYCRPPRT